MASSRGHLYDHSARVTDLDGDRQIRAEGVTFSRTVQLGAHRREERGPAGGEASRRRRVKYDGIGGVALMATSARCRSRADGGRSRSVRRLSAAGVTTRAARVFGGAWCRRSAIASRSSYRQHHRIGRPSADSGDVETRAGLCECRRCAQAIVTISAPRSAVSRARRASTGARSRGVGVLFVRRLEATTPSTARAWTRLPAFTNKVRPIRRHDDAAASIARSPNAYTAGLSAIGFEPMAVDIKRFVRRSPATRSTLTQPLTKIHTFGVHRHHRHITLSRTLRRELHALNVSRTGLARRRARRRRSRGSRGDGAPARLAASEDDDV